MKNFILILVVALLIPVIWFMGIRGKSWNEMVTEIGLYRYLGRPEQED